MSDLLTSGDVAKLLHVTPKTITRWAGAGFLRHTRTEGGHRRFAEQQVREDYDALIARRSKEKKS